MKSVFQKIAAIIIIAIGIIFAIVIGIIAFTIINNMEALGGVFTYDRIGFTLLLVLGIVYLLLSFYLIFSLFGNRVNLKTMVLTSDNFSAVSTTNRVVRRLIKICVASVGGMKLQQTRITEDDKPGFKLGIKLRVFDGNVHKQTQKLKFLLEDTFKRELAFSFNSIVIRVTSIRSVFKPDIKRAQAYIEAKEEEEDCKADCKIAEATPSDQTVIEENLTPQELDNVSRPPEDSAEKESTHEDIKTEEEEENTDSNNREVDNEELTDIDSQEIESEESIEEGIQQNNYDESLEDNKHKVEEKNFDNLANSQEENSEEDENKNN